MEANQGFTRRLRLNNASGISIIPIQFPPELVLPTGSTKVSEVLEITNFKARASIKSLAPSRLPDFMLEDSDTERLMKSLDIEWRSPRKQLNLMIGEQGINGLTYSLVGSISLLNTTGYPYRLYDLKQIYSNADNVYVGRNSTLALQIQDVGYGLLMQDDICDIWCDFIQTISYFVPTVVNISPANEITLPAITIQNILTGGTITTPPEEDEDMALTILTTATYTAKNKDRILIDNRTPDNAVVTLPASPALGDEIEFIRAAGTKTISIELNSKKYNGEVLERLGMSGSGRVGKLFYAQSPSGENGWYRAYGEIDTWYFSE